MALATEWREQGNTLFKFRSYIPIITIILCGLFLYFRPNDMAESMQPGMWIAICFAVSMIGQYIRGHAVGHSDFRTSGRNTSAGQVAESINKTGLYSQIRHPLYLGNYFMWVGPLMYPGSIELFVIGSMFYWFYYEKIMYAEESFLIDKFGSAYTEWSKSTPAIVPKFRAWKKANNSFSFKRVIRQEYLGFCAVFFVLSLLAAIESSLTSGGWYVEEPTKIVFFIGLGLFLIIRAISKLTPMLLPSEGV